MKKTNKKSVSVFVRKTLLCFALPFIFLGGMAFSEPGIIYISPNNDGVNDYLEVPFKILEKRHIKEWSFTILNEEGEIVRTIGNKISLPNKLTFKSFGKTLVTPKKGVDVPPSVVWNGYLDDGSLAEDGLYYWYITAADDNGNTSVTSKLQVFVDNTPPEIDLLQPNEDEKTFGEGNKAILKIKQSGSTEKLWTAKITDAQGKTIKSYKWENSSPLEIEWNGMSDEKEIVPDGVYSYEVTSTDLAGNVSEKAYISGIIFSAEKPKTAISIEGSRYFAPSPRGSVAFEKKSVDIGVVIPSPSASVNRLTDWEISIVGKNDDKVLYSLSGKENPPSSFSFDGKNNDGVFLTDGEYRAKVTARYLNGYEPEPIYSPIFVIDNEAPKVEVFLPSNLVFNGKNSFEISQRGSEEPSYTGEKAWIGKIIDSDKKIVRHFFFDSSLPSKVKWDGLDDNGQFVPDGNYRYILEVLELAGNTESTETLDFTFDTSKTELALSVSPKAFSPNGDGVQDTVTLTSVAKASSGIESYELKITGSGSVKTFSGKGQIPSSFVWDGTDDNGEKFKDGVCSAVIKTVANSGTEEAASCPDFILDTVSPSVSLSSPYTIFSPDGIGKRQNIPVSVSECSLEAKWTAEVRNNKNEIVKSFSWTNGSVKNFLWDGTDNNGNKAENGTYSILVSSKDEAGNTGSSAINGIVLDSRPVSGFLTTDLNGISPNADGVFDTQKFNIKVSLNEGISSWALTVIDEKKAIVKTFSGKSGEKLPSVIEWSGDTSSGKIAEGRFSARLHVEYEKGNFFDAVSGSFICTTQPPLLDVRTSPRYFSPDNDGNDDDLFVQLKCETIAGLKNWDFTIKDRNGKPFWKTSGKKSITEKIIWDGRGNNGELVQSAEDYPFEFCAYDELGMSSKFEGVISVDVLVILDGSKLKMQIPSIIFRSDEADFVVGTFDSDGNVIKPGITQAQADNNARVLKRVSEILKKFKDYNVVIVGHANRTSDNSDEETKTGSWGKALIPLSEDRAEYVKDQLVKMGISSSRLSVEGKGGTEPVADRKDSSVNWKNRRVEFILER